MSKNELTINAELLVLCERMEIARFAHAYLQYLRRQGASLPTLQLFCYRSLEQLPAFVKKLPHIPGSEQVRRAVILADAKNDIEERGNIIIRVRKNAFFVKREHSAHFFFPGRPGNKRWKNGYLEDLLLEVLRKETSESSNFYNLLNSAHEYLLTVKNCREGQKLQNYNRHLLYAYLTGTEKYVGCDLAAAARLGAFDLDSRLFNGLKRALLG